MGMTIDDNVDFLNDAKKLFENIANNPSINETIKTYFIIESLESAIDIMRKYRKIKEIVKRYEHPDKEETDKFYWDVIGVIEDEKID